MMGRPRGHVLCSQSDVPGTWDWLPPQAPNAGLGCGHVSRIDPICSCFFPGSCDGSSRPAESTLTLSKASLSHRDAPVQPFPSPTNTVHSRRSLLCPTMSYFWAVTCVPSLACPSILFHKTNAHCSFKRQAHCQG